MKVGIIGFGFVGRALRNGLKDEVDCIEVDPKLETDVNDLINHKPEIVFICLPTPMNENGTQDIDLVSDTIKEINEFDKDALIVLKSTILPKHINDILNLSSNVVVNPEFLKENSANEDFINSEIIVFGGGEDNCKKLANFYGNYTNCICKDYVFTDEISASLIKYTINSFLALKVIFFNEMKSVFDNLNTNNDWSDFIEALSKDKRMGNSHMKVPGPDGRHGFGGACFPKDVNALIEYSKEIDLELSLLKKANIINNNIRAQYNEVTAREKEQNIKFKVDNEE